MREETRKKRRELAGLQGVVLGCLLLAEPARAELPDYTLQLQARTNLPGNKGGAYNMEPGNLLAGSLQVPITSDRKVAFRLAITPEKRSSVWWGGDGRGERIYQMPDFGTEVSTGDPSINSAGGLAFSVTGTNDVTQSGIYLLNVSAPDKVQIIREPLGVSGWSSVTLNEAGQIGFRATFSGLGRIHALVSPGNDGFETRIVAREQSVDAKSPYLFLYSPNLNDLGQMIGVADLAPISSEYFQELRVWNADGTSRRIAATRGLEPSSPIYRFASVAPSLNNKGQVAFLGTAKDPAGKNLSTLWLWDGTGLKVLAQDGRDRIRTVESFPPDLNDRGLTAFRAIDDSALRAVWVSDGESMKRVATEHDLVPSDLGEARLDQETASNPVFGGSTMINERGDVTFTAGLTPPDDDQEEWGTGVYVALSSLAPEPPDAGTGGPDAGSGGPDAGTGEPDAGSGEPDAGAGGSDAGTGEPDAGSGGPDAGAGGSDAGTRGPDAEAPDTGCGCQSTSLAAIWPWLLLGLMVSRKNRARLKG
ncbi:MXAN_5453 family MXYO-CTERM-anchored protein [Archangium lipolyticum]|uniref:MXAN_5453 family MXYO-CTERM-anchored protein n=1 Tax=Archangium lipolyticum TaxID=2970465 RepID=UPI002149D33A|nr:MXAN_5453 family MXYO-CTERM-anchored protein [Archangium lipolyticum]